jgi:uncharacterized membrane protein
METIGTGLFNRRMAAVYNNITNSIAFYPIIITVFYLALVISMLQLDDSPLGHRFTRFFPWLQFGEMEAVRAIMTTLIAGIISLMALSFSMVMVVLNQATTTISPKVMQGLITRKEHQFVLGNQFGAIVYFMVLLLLVRGSAIHEIPSMSIALGVLLGFWSLGLFVYFIHNISQAIQVTNIIVHIHEVTFRSLVQLKKDCEAEKARSTGAPLGETPYPYVTDKPGFLQQVNLKNLMRVARKHNLQLKMEPYFMDFIPSGSVLCWANIPPEKLPKKDRNFLYDSIHYFHTENIATNHNYGFTQLSEVAIKALSHAINDPGIAVMCIQFLSDLFANLYYIEETSLYTDETQTPRLLVKKINFEELFNLTISPIRHYGKKDQAVARALLGLLYVVAEEDLQEQKYRHLLNLHANAVLEGIKDTLIIPPDAMTFNKIIGKMQTMEPAYFEVQKFEIPE